MSKNLKWIEIPVTRIVKRKLGDLLKELQAKGENVKTEDDVLTYLLEHFEEKEELKK